MQVLENAAEGGGAGRGPGPAPLRVRRQRQMLPEHPVPLAHRFPGVAAASRRQLRRARGWDTGGRAPCGNTATRTPQSQHTQPHATTRGWGRPLPTPAPNQPGDKNGYSQGRAGPWPPAHAPTGSRCVGAGLEPAPSLSGRTPPPPTHSPRPDAIFSGPTNHAPARGGGGRAATARCPAAHLLRPIAGGNCRQSPTGRSRSDSAPACDAAAGRKRRRQRRPPPSHTGGRAQLSIGLLGRWCRTARGGSFRRPQPALQPMGTAR